MKCHDYPENWAHNLVEENKFAGRTNEYCRDKGEQRFRFRRIKIGDKEFSVVPRYFHAAPSPERKKERSK